MVGVWFRRPEHATPVPEVCCARARRKSVLPLVRHSPRGVSCDWSPLHRVPRGDGPGGPILSPLFPGAAPVRLQVVSSYSHTPSQVLFILWRGGGLIPPGPPGTDLTPELGSRRSSRDTDCRTHGAHHRCADEILPLFLYPRMHLMDSTSWSQARRASPFLRSVWRRTLGTVAVAVGGLVAVILYLGFFATHYAWYENLAVVLVIAVLVPVFIVALWISWAYRLCTGEGIRDIDAEFATTV